MRSHVPAILLSTLSAAACAGDEPGGVRSVQSFEAPAAALPGAASLEYRTFSKELADPALARTAQHDLVVDQQPDVAGVAVRAKKKSSNEAEAVHGYHLDRAGAMMGSREHPGPLVDLAASLPSVDRLVIGEPYKSGEPAREYMHAAFDAGSSVIWQTTVNTPTAIWQEGDAAVVRVDVQGNHTMFDREPNSFVKREHIGLAYRGITDLLYTPETGWVVLDMQRIAETEKIAGDVSALSYRQLAAYRHSEFVVCLDTPALAQHTDLVAAARRDLTACR